MPEQKQFRISEFPRGTEIWRLDWLDGLVRNPTLHEEYLVRVVLRAVPGSTLRDINSLNEAMANDSFRCSVGIGHLPRLKLGSLWRDGVLLEEQAGEFRSYRVVVSEETTHLSRGVTELDPDLVLPYRVHRISDAGKSKNLVIKVNEMNTLVIPAFEAIRFYYASSTRLTHATFAGAFHNDMNEVLNNDGTVIADKEQSGKKEKHAYVKLRTWFRDNDAWTIARIRFAETAARGVGRVFGSIVQEKAILPTKEILFPEVGFPFTGPSTLGVKGRVVPDGPEKWKFWVYSIEQCSGPFPYDELIVRRDNSGLKAANETPDDEKTIAWTPGYARPERFEDEGDETLEDDEPFEDVQSVEGATPDIQPIASRIAPSHFLAIAGKRLKKPHPDKNHYKSAIWKPFLNPGLERLSTGMGNGENVGVGLALYELEREQRLAMTGGISNLRAVADFLSQDHGMQTSERHPVPDLTDAIPRELPPNRGQWAYLRSKSRKKRDVLIIDATFEENVFSLVEFAWRTSEEKSGGFLLAILYSSTGDPVSTDQMGLILKDLAIEEGRWDKLKPNLSDDVLLTTMKHVWEGPEEGAEKVAAKIHGLLQKKQRS